MHNMLSESFHSLSRAQLQSWCLHFHLKLIMPDCDHALHDPIFQMILQTEAALSKHTVEDSATCELTASLLVTCSITSSSVLSMLCLACCAGQAQPQCWMARTGCGELSVRPKCSNNKLAHSSKWRWSYGGDQELDIPEGWWHMWRTACHAAVGTHFAASSVYEAPPIQTRSITSHSKALPWLVIDAV